jgi:indole-3-acetate monooxygenase
MPKTREAPPADTAGPVERIARIAKVIEASSARNEQLGRLAPEVVDKLHEQRLLRMLLPSAYGGEEVDLGTWFRAMEALARLDGSTAWCVGQINGCAATAAALDPAVARKMWDGPRSALSWGPPVRSRADEVEGGHRLTGEWMFASGSRHATWIGLWAPVFDKTGAQVALPSGAPMTIFFTPAENVEFIDNWKVAGLVATNSGGFKADGLFIPHGYSVVQRNPLASKLASRLYKFPMNSFFAIGFSAVALGLARSMLDACVALAREKKPRMARFSLIENHQVQFQIGEAEARLRSARGFVEATAERIHAAVMSSGELSIAQRLEIRMAGTFAIHEAKAVADVAWEIAGANSIFSSGPFERRYRDISTVMQLAQGRKAHLQDVGAHILGLEPSLIFA